MNQPWHPGAPAQLPGKLGPFAILAQLGEGGSGVVYAARWGHREVALKVLRPQTATTESDRERFMAEARMLAEIEHPSVVKVLNVGMLPDGRPYLAMEKLEGETLAQRLARGPLYLGESLALFAQLCDAVDALHARGLVHRDLKPENVFLTGGGRYAVLLDFGIAKELHAPASTVTQDGGVRGTPAYMAPERFFGQPAGKRSDIYELGVVLYSMVVGRLPWHDVADPEARLNPVRPSAQGVELPGQLEVELLRALSTRPEARPESASMFLDRIDAALQAGGAGPVVRRTADLGGPREVAQLQAAQAQAQARQVLAAHAAPMLTPDRVATRPIAHHPPTPPPGGRGMTGIRREGGAPGWPWLVLILGLSGLAFIVVMAIVTNDKGDEQAELPPWTDEEPAKEVTKDDKVVDLLPSAAWTEPSATRALAAVVPAAAPGGATDAAKYFPSDEALIFTVRVRDLLDSAAFGPALRNLKDSPDLAPAVLFAKVCKLDPFADLDWAAVGLPPGDSADLDFVLSGNLDRKAIGKCAADMDIDAEVTWIDDRTIFFSTRDVTVTPDKSFAAGNAALLARTDLGGTLWIAGDPESAFGPPVGDELPMPRRIAGGARLGNDLAIDAWLHYASAAEARKAVDIANRELDGIGAILGDPKLERTGADVRLTAKVDPLITALLGAAIEAAAKP